MDHETDNSPTNNTPFTIDVDDQSTSEMSKAIILTALPVEYKAVREHLTDLQEKTHLGTVYELGKFLSAGQSWEVGIVEIGAGNPIVAMEAERAIRYFGPDVILFVGVAGGIKDVNLGDVVAATKVYGYESGKDEVTFQPRAEVGRLAYRLEQRARAEARKGNWLRRIKGPHPSDSSFRAFVGPVAAGAKIVASTRSATYEFLRSQYSDALAVEMEGYGFSAAIRANPGVEALVIRGISDLVDKKGDADVSGYQEIAAQNASAFTFEMLANFRIRDELPKKKLERVSLPSEPSAQTRTTAAHFEPSPDAPETVLIPAGPFWMGSPRDDPTTHPNEQPRFKRDIVEYQIGRYPITNAQYACFLSANPDHPVPYSDDKEDQPYNWDPETRTCPEGKADHPVVLVSWQDAVAYCQWLCQITGQFYRLPTEEEWEKAARGALRETHRYPWGNEWQANYGNTQETGRNGTTSVYEFEQVNRSPFGIVDMVGNAWEWTASWYEPYPDSQYEGSRYGQTHKVVRGGSWRNSRRQARVSCRGRYSPDVRRSYLGFRVALDVDREKSTLF